MAPNDWQQENSALKSKSPTLGLGLLLDPAVVQGAMAQGAASAITEREAHAIAVDAYLSVILG